MLKWYEYCMECGEIDDGRDESKHARHINELITIDARKLHELITDNLNDLKYKSK